MNSHAGEKSLRSSPRLLTEFPKAHYGVPQGSILGPLLLIIFMNDLPKAVKSADICMYAEDTSMSSTIKNTRDLEIKIIPKFLNICNRLKSNKLILNALKTEFMIMGSHQRVGTIGCARTIPAIVADGKVVKRVAHTKSLGIVVDEYLSSDKHIDYILKKLKHNIGVIKRVCSVIPKQSLVTLYRTPVEPYLRYGNSIWGQCGKTHIQKLQTLQNRAARIVAGKPFEETDHVLLLKELQWLNVEKLIDNDNAVLVYKMKNGITPDHCSETYSFEEITHPYDTKAAHSKFLQLNRYNSSYGQISFSYAGVKVWNRLLEQVRDAPSLHIFKNRVKDFLLYKDS